MELSRPYSREHAGFLVHDFDRGKFESLETMNGGEGLMIAVPPLESALDALTRMLPQATTRGYDAIEEVIDDPSVTGILMSLERAYYCSRVRPDWSAVRPEGLNTASVIVYAMPNGEQELRSLIDLWIETRRASGDEDEAYAYWIRGKALTPRNRGGVSCGTSSAGSRSDGGAAGDPCAREGGGIVRLTRNCEWKPVPAKQ